MKLNIGPKDLNVDFEFSIYKKVLGKEFIGGHLANIKQIGVYLSGGLDSCTLLCLILTELKNLNQLDKIPEKKKFLEGLDQDEVFSLLKLKSNGSLLYQEYEYLKTK